MMVHKSFTSTWLAFCRGDVTAEDLSERTTMLVFNCARAHLYPEQDDGTVPGEVSWCMKREELQARDIKHAALRVLVSKLPTEVVEKWAEFSAVLDHANETGRLVFRDDLQPYRVSVKGNAEEAKRSANDHGCNLRIPGLELAESEGPHPSTIMTVWTTLLTLGLWFNECPMPSNGQPYPVGSLLFYNYAGTDAPEPEVPALAMARPPEGHYPEDYIGCP